MSEIPDGQTSAPLPAKEYDGHGVIYGERRKLKLHTVRSIIFRKNSSY